HPAYLITPIESFVAIVITMPKDQIGDFSPGAPPDAGGALIAAAPIQDGGGTFGNVIFPFAQVVGSDIGVTQFDLGPGGQGKGAFDVLVADTNGQGHEFFGHYTSTVCPGISQAQFPF